MTRNRERDRGIPIGMVLSSAPGEKTMKLEHSLDLNSAHQQARMEPV